MLPEDDRMIETCRSVLSVLMQILYLLNNPYMCICWCVTEINYRTHGATVKIITIMFSYKFPSCFSVPFQKIVSAAVPILFTSYKTIWYNWKTYWSCRKGLLLLPTEVYKWRTCVKEYKWCTCVQVYKGRTCVQVYKWCTYVQVCKWCTCVQVYKWCTCVQVYKWCTYVQVYKWCTCVQVYKCASDVLV